MSVKKETGAFRGPNSEQCLPLLFHCSLFAGWLPHLFEVVVIVLNEQVAVSQALDGRHALVHRDLVSEAPAGREARGRRKTGGGAATKVKDRSAPSSTVERRKEREAREKGFSVFRAGSEGEGKTGRQNEGTGVGSGAAPESREWRDPRNAPVLDQDGLDRFQRLSQAFRLHSLHQVLRPHVVVRPEGRLRQRHANCLVHFFHHPSPQGVLTTAT